MRAVIDFVLAAVFSTLFVVFLFLSMPAPSAIWMALGARWVGGLDMLPSAGLSLGMYLASRAAWADGFDLFEGGQ